VNLSNLENLWLVLFESFEQKVGGVPRLVVMWRKYIFSNVFICLIEESVSSAA
jgi:hypothetical protein